MGERDKISRKDFLRGVIGLGAAGLFGMRAGAAEKSAPPLDFKLAPAGELEPRMAKLLGIAIDGEHRIYAAGADGIKIFERGGKLIRAIKTSGAACAVAVDEDGNVYAAQRARIEKFSNEGKLLTAWGKLGDGDGEFRLITSIAAGKRTIYVADAGARVIHKFSHDGDYAGEIAGDSRGKFVLPSAFFDVAIGEKDGLLVGHAGRHRVERYDANGKLMGHWGKYGTAREDFCGCCNPTNIAVFADGSIATAEKGVPRLKVHDAGGKLLAYLGPEAFPGNAAGMDLAVDSKGRIALVEPVSNKIRFYEARNQH